MQERAGFYPFSDIPMPVSAVNTLVENGVRYLVDIGEG